jgi:hypothetical protein
MCRNEKKLCLSHLMPAGIYPLCENDKREHVSVTSDVTMPTQRQTRAYLLCDSCENNNLNKNGERYVIPLLSRLNGPFQLYDRLVKQTPVEVLHGDPIYAAATNPEIDVAKFIHFAVGIFWKASVHPFGRGETPRIDIGADSDALRLFLVGKSPLPNRIALAVAVESGPIRYPAMIDPFRGDNLDFKNFFFYVPGMMMQLYIGDEVRKAVGAYSVNLNPLAPIFLQPLAKVVRGNLAKNSAESYKTEKLLKMIADNEAQALNIRLE